VKLARAGCTTCWSSHLLHTLCSLDLLDGGWRQLPLDWLLGRSWEEGVVQQTLDALFKARWGGPFPDDPRVPPTQGLLCVSMRGAGGHCSGKVSGGGGGGA